MSKHMNSPQSDGIVLAEEASFSDAARVKRPQYRGLDNPESEGDNLNSNLFWGKESRRIGPVKNDSPEKILF